jgi:hypothetical protein
MRAAGAAVAVLHLVLAAVLGTVLFFVLCALVSLALAFSVAPLLRPRGGGDDDPGGGPAEPEPPPWWPDFERQFRGYAARRRRVKA